jgi:hypothetical protein
MRAFLYHFRGSEDVVLSKTTASSGPGWRYDAEQDIFFIENGGWVRITEATQSSIIVIEGAATVTLDDVTMDLEGLGGIDNPVCPIDLLYNGKKATLNLKLAGDNWLRAGNYTARAYMSQKAPRS